MRAGRVLCMFALLAAAPSACRRDGASPAAPRADSTLPPTAGALLQLAAELADEPVTARDDGAAASLRDLARAARVSEAGGPAAALNRALFETGGFSRVVDDPDLRYVLLPSVLATRRGSCVGLGTLYLALAELLGVPARGVMMPGHFYVQVAGANGWRNVELLRRGEEMPPSWYQERYPARGEPRGAYGRPLSPREVLGVVAYDAGNQRRRQGRLAQARQAYERAVREFPAFAEAHAGLGATLHLLGDLDAAAAAYQAARTLDPGLSGLERNLALLEAERRAAR